MAIKPGTLADFGGSMAAAMESELNLMLADAGLPELPNAEPERSDHRRLFVAIARGVVKHLLAQQTSMTVPYQDDGTNRTTSVALVVTGV
jgi:hypothetical protein